MFLLGGFRDGRRAPRVTALSFLMFALLNLIAKRNTSGAMLLVLLGLMAMGFALYVYWLHHRNCQSWTGWFVFVVASIVIITIVGYVVHDFDRPPPPPPEEEEEDVKK